LTVQKYSQLGITSFKYPWDYLNYHYNQHIAVFYDVEELSGKIEEIAPQFDGQDSLGAVFIPLENISIRNASPLVLKAKEYLLNNRRFEDEDTIFDEWTVLENAVF
jgi:hypothetical protein